MSSPLYHLLSMAEMPQVEGSYLYSIEDENHSWTQEASWLLLMADHAGVMTVGARTQVYQPYAVFVIPPGHRCTIARTSPEGTAFFGRFMPVDSGAPMLAVPAYKQLDDAGTFWDRRLRSALNRSYQMRKEMKVVVIDLLWSIGVDPGSIRQKPALAAAEKFIEESLRTPLRVSDVAEKVGISHNQLIRLFQEEHGVSPVEYIRHRRQNQACRLLLETSMPVKQIADAVGIYDLAQFNRLVKSASGMSPRELRATTRPANLFRV